MMDVLADEHILNLSKPQGRLFNSLFDLQNMSENQEADFGRNITSRQRKHAFRLGFIHGLQLKFELQIKSDCMELMVMPKQRVEDAFDDLNCTEVKKKVSSQVQSAVSFDAGLKHGAKFSATAGEIKHE